MWGCVRVGLMASLCAAVAVAQDDDFEQLALRMSSVRPNGDLVIDRGRRDFVQPGDRVVLTPRNGPSVQGTVAEVDERSATVQGVDRNAVLPIGTKGYVLVPKARRATKPVDVPLPPKEAPVVEKKPDDEWEPGMPLLGTTRPPRPAERPRAIHGRLYTSADVVRTLNSWSHSFLTAGLDVEVDNPRGDGGVLRFHGEFDLSTEAATERSGSDLRLYEVSYEQGGTRFDPLHWQVGRFLPRDMPEFGLLDGGAVGFRRESGSRLGASFGYLPELDEDLESFADLQIALWYLWNSDVSERLSWGLGYQKSWHRYDQDRDLVVIKGRYLPVDGWNFASTFWIDFYSGRDALKDRSVGLTRANVFVNRRWKDKGGLVFAYDHEEYPDILRRELPQTLQPVTLVDAHQDRLSVHAFTFAGDGTRWFTRLTGWADEEREGGSGELGFEVGGRGAGARSGFAVFGVTGLTSNVFGVRLERGDAYGWGRLDLLYELGFVYHQGFPHDSNELLQHRLGALVTSDLGSSWDCVCHGDATLWDSDVSFGIGIYLQRLF